MSKNEGKAKVSIIVPVYNNEKYIKKCIGSLLNQSYKNIEIIVINDGSKDCSHALLSALVSEDERIRYFYQENAGVSRARNLGVQNATGKYITFVDGDDYVVEDYIAELCQCAENLEADMVICGMTMVDEQGDVLQKILPGDYIRGKKEEWTFRISAVAAHFYRRELWEKYDVSFIEGERGEDIPVSLFFSGVCEKICTWKKAGYYYVQHRDSASHNFQGLKQYKLPYKGLENAIVKLNEIGIKNSNEFHELFVLRILATFIQLAKGASKYEVRILYEYINYILDTYYPNYYKNRLIRLFANIEVPFFQKAAVWILAKAKKWGILKIVLYVSCM